MIIHIGNVDIIHGVNPVNVQYVAEHLGMSVLIGRPVPLSNKWKATDWVGSILVVPVDEVFANDCA